MFDKKEFTWFEFLYFNHPYLKIKDFVAKFEKKKIKKKIFEESENSDFSKEMFQDKKIPSPFK